MDVSNGEEPYEINDEEASENIQSAYYSQAEMKSMMKRLVKISNQLIIVKISNQLIIAKQKLVEKVLMFLLEMP